MAELYPNSFQIEEPSLDEFEAQVEAELASYRNVRVRGALGDIVFKTMPIPWERVKQLWAKGVAIPLDLMPSEYWHRADPDTYSDTNGRGDFIMPFSEEALGEAF